MASTEESCVLRRDFACWSTVVGRSWMVPCLLVASAGAALLSTPGCSKEESATLIANGAGSAGSGGTSTAGDAGSTGEDEFCPGTGVSKRPWVLTVDGSSAKLRWEACRDGTSPEVSLMPEQGGAAQKFTAQATSFTINNTYKAPLNPNAPPDKAGTYFMHESMLTGLAEGTCYSYTLSQDSSATGRFCTARASGSPFTFVGTADTNPGLGESTSQLLHVINNKPYDFTVHGGDIEYYDSGLETWSYWFTKMTPMLAHGGFFPSIGNHESEKPDEYEQYYVRLFGKAGFDGTDGYYRFQTGGVWFFSLDTESAMVVGSPQYVWFEAQLKDASEKPGYRFSVVFLHRPFLTCGDTGQKDAERAGMEPLFEKYKVPLILQGHMHGYEHFEVPQPTDTSKTFTYLTIGGGGGLLGDIDGNSNLPTCTMRTQAAKAYHIAVFDVKAGSIHTNVLGTDGSIIDSFDKQVP
jgi:acid phosphatase type 7